MNASAKQAKADELRERYRQFTYESFSYEAIDGDLALRFHFSIVPEIRFAPEIRIKSIAQSRIDSIDSTVLDGLVFHLGLIEMLSYWKATCSPGIIVKPGSMNAEQIAWWKDLLRCGMGEFFYVNGIDFRQPDFVDIRVASKAGGAQPYDNLMSDRTLVMSSGGKDTALTLQLIQEAGEEFNCVMLNPLPAASGLVARAGCGSPVIVKRTIDPGLLDLNRRGFLNGHTPFSALLSFLGVTCAVLSDYRTVVVSNERSSNEANVEFLGTQVNHQYSKTFDFEQRFRSYSRKYLASEVDYFSLLRPLYEIQIIRLMAGYPGLLPIFRSCNRNQLEGTWCGRCPKCISVFTLFYPFVPHSELIRTFGEDFFEREDAIRVVKELAGTTGHKPFECVGTHEETIAGLYLGLQRARKERKELPAALRFAEQEILPAYPQAEEMARSVLSAWCSEHNLPLEFETLLRQRLNSAAESEEI
ncbi:MAG TPA: hypothetical protein VGV87_07295 [Blastocatellia bacterium]|nr:hypothetical protein [Blastocatellia bacterium]